MARIWGVGPGQEPTGKAKELLDGVNERLGMTPTMMNVMAASPAVLHGYLSFIVALADGTLEGKFRQQIALTVAEANCVPYCVTRHAAIARRMGLTEEEILASRNSQSDDSKEDAGLKFARELVVSRGRVNDEMFLRLRSAGHSDTEIVEVVANVALNIFSNYLNLVAGTDHAKAAEGSGP